MAFFEFELVAVLLLVMVCLIPICRLIIWKILKPKNYSSHIPTDWPLLGMIPAVLHNSHRLHDLATDVLIGSHGTFLLKGPWFANMDMLFTSDPANIHHILSKNFPNYPKGPEFRKIFNILGDGIFNSDSELWEIHRKTTMMSLFNHANFHTSLESIVWSTVEQGLIPVLDFASQRGMQADLQEIFQRFSFDGICKLILGHDPKSLSVDLPDIPCEKAFTPAEEALMYRHIFPEKLWKLQKWLHVGKEEKLNQAWKVFDDFLYKCISWKEEQKLNTSDHMNNRNWSNMVERDDDQQYLGKEEELDLSAAFIRAYYKEINKGTAGSDSVADGDQAKQFLRDTFLNLMIAGRDTTSTALTWFFYLLTKNPLVESKIREEIQKTLHIAAKGEKWKSNFGVNELRKMVYLHGALSEALRLYPPVALEHKTPLEPDILPSGHRVDRGTKIILSFYTMGRMESIWGKDCLEFKPERWISERGGTKHEPSFKFTAFHAGPRTCMGKEMAFIQMKIVATTIVYNYHVEVVEGHPIAPSDSIILQTKHGLKVRVTKRN